tara:strand:- start:551 stop:1588 length:1038 start_codon:yes stop_codon:yes gene_type:complete
MSYSRKKILDKEFVNIDFPENIKAKHKNLFQNELKRTNPAAYLYHLKNVRFNKKMYPLTFNLKIVSDFLKLSSISRYKIIKKFFLLLYYFFFLFTKKSYSKKIIKKGIIIHDRHSNNYFHWVTDVLPKLIIAKQKKLLKDKIIILPNFKSKFQLDSIKKVSKNVIYNSVPVNDLIVENLTYVSDLHFSGYPRKIYLKKLQSLFVRDLNKNRKPIKIYISRSNSDRRKLTNESNLIKILKKKKFKILRMEKLKFYDQIKYCSRASIIISLHGAGLTNLIWMKKKTKLIEIRGSEDKNLNPYFVMCKHLGIKYYYFLTKKNFLSYFFSHQDYKLDIKIFLKEFKSFL